uniref:Uncharacterized protein n=1 Tax=Cucumis melo TaxID=3656 RepID=A0A9I9EKA9_CUCME
MLNNTSIRCDYDIKIKDEKREERRKNKSKRQSKLLELVVPNSHQQKKLKLSQVWMRSKHESPKSSKKKGRNEPLKEDNVMKKSRTKSLLIETQIVNVLIAKRNFNEQILMNRRVLTVKRINETKKMKMNKEKRKQGIMRNVVQKQKKQLIERKNQ